MEPSDFRVGDEVRRTEFVTTGFVPIGRLVEVRPPTVVVHWGFDPIFDHYIDLRCLELIPRVANDWEDLLELC